MAGMGEGALASRETAAPAGSGRGTPLIQEFLRDQLPLLALTLGGGLLASHLQHGYVAGIDGRAFPLAGVYVPLWHLIWMGFWTGYTMALVGEASGIFSLPYSMSVLRFDGTNVSPTNSILTFLNPLGALLGFRREKQWNLDFAVWPCLGTLIGSQIGPFLRVLFLNDPLPFKAVTGAVLALLGVHLVYQITPGYLRRTRVQQEFKAKFEAHARAMASQGKLPSGLPPGAELKTVAKSWRFLTIEFWDHRWTLSVPGLFVLGAGVGVVSSTFGVGGGFLMTPIMVTLFQLPMYVIVAATLPYVFVQSAVALFSYTVTVPLLTGVYTEPEWSWGLFAASGAILGAWLAAKTQKYVPESSLKPIAGVLTAVTGTLYVVNYLFGLPFEV